MDLGQILSSEKRSWAHLSRTKIINQSPFRIHLHKHPLHTQIYKMCAHTGHILDNSLLFSLLSLINPYKNLPSPLITFSSASASEETKFPSGTRVVAAAFPKHTRIPVVLDVGSLSSLYSLKTNPPPI